MISRISFKQFLLPSLYRVLGRLLERNGVEALALACYRGAAESNSADWKSAFLAGKLLLLREQFAAAAEAFGQALRARPDYVEALNNLGVALFEQGLQDEAAESYHAALSHQPDYVPAINNLGNVHLSQGQLGQAEASFRRALSIDPAYVEAHNNLGTALLEQGRFEEAERALREALRLRPDYAGAMSNLGATLMGQRKPEEAVQAYRDALRLQPKLGQAHANLALILNDRSNTVQATEHFEKEVRRNPRSPQAHNRLGVAYQYQARYDDAAREFEAALEARPDFAEAYCSMGSNAMFLGDAASAMERYRKALSLRADPGYQSCYAFTMNYLPDCSPWEITEAYKAWAGLITPPVAAPRAPINSIDPARRLRVGYVSPDFARHSVAYFIEPVIRNHDRAEVEVFCYSNVATPDDYTERLKSLADHWREIRLKSDDQVCEMIQADRIDILVDLAGHTAFNRLSVFTRRPAPVQVTYLGHPNTSGLDAIDYRVTDALADPPGLTEAHNSEQLERLTGCFLVYSPPANAPEIAPPPKVTKGFVTFGSFNNAAKVNQQVISLWARVLGAMPGSRLLLKSYAFASASARANMAAKFDAHGIAPERVELMAWAPELTSHLELYREIDIALDTFPYNGTTTTCEALWMGVPVIVQIGTTHAARVGLSLLHHAGLSEFVASDADDYVRIALKLANDATRLETLRSSLRERLRSSVLCDALGFTRRLEGAYREMWRRWCDTAAHPMPQASRVSPIPEDPSAIAGEAGERLQPTIANA